MKLLTTGFFLLFLCIACTSEPEPADPPIAHDKMVDVLIDLHVMNGILQRYHGSMKDSLRIVYRNQIHEIHDITESEIDSIMAYLTAEPKVAESIYKELLDEMTLLREK